MKKCTKCGIEKPLSEFHKHKNTKDGHRYDCKACRKHQQTLYYQQNKEKIAERKTLYYQENKDKFAERDALYYQENKEKIAERGARYYQENKEKIAERGSPSRS